jgi:hypothetical protein
MARDGFLSRWSQKKLAEQAPGQHESSSDEEPAAETVAETAEAVAGEPIVADGDPVALADEPALSEEELAALPKIEDITAQTDLKQFMRRGVPKALKLAAMRKMWTVNPVISTYLDEARDYAYDWNTPGGVPGSGGTIDLADAARRVERLLSGGKAREAASEDGAVPPGDRESNPAVSKAEQAHEITVQEIQPALTEECPADKTLVLGSEKGRNQTNLQNEPPATKRRHGSALPKIT